MDSTHHVHFDEAMIADGLHDNRITYEAASKTRVITIHLGFLQIKHRYRIDLNIPMYAMEGMSLNASENSRLVQVDTPVANINCKLEEFPTEPIIIDEKEHYAAVVELFAHKEKLLKEHITVCGKENPAIKLELIFLARVLGKGKGTPMLRDGIHCIGLEAGDDDESELSDWQGNSPCAK